MMWLLSQAVRQAIEHAQKSGVMPTAEQQIEYEARHAPASADSSRVLSSAGGTATIAISGVITKAPSFFASLFGGGNVTYPEIISALAQAEGDDDIKEVVLAVDSPGGQVDGLFEAIDAIQAFSKPIRSVVHNQASSAAYAIASQTDTIQAANRATRVGSIGIVASFYADPNEVDITSTNAPKKRPDVATAEGRAQITEELDALHEIFVEAIATGRDTTDKKINAEFGQGATVLAGEALKRGMIDSIASVPLKAVKKAGPTTAESGTQPEATDMDLNKLRAEHPAVYAEAVGHGATQERDRISAHLIMGEASGDMKTALAAAKEGTEMTAAMQATYMTAGMNRQDVEDRQADDADANAGDGAHASAADADTTAAAAILNAAAASCAVSLEV